MNSSLRQYLRSVFNLGSGEALGRLANVAIVVLIGHRFGVVVLGVYSLATTLATYVQPVVDFGLKHVGARLVARFPASVLQIVQRVQHRRLQMTLVVVPLLAVYAGFATLNLGMKVFVFAFAAIAVLYAASLEWVAWGAGELRLVGLARAVVPLCLLVFLAAGAFAGSNIFVWAVAGHAVGYLLQTAVFWRWWHRHSAGEHYVPESGDEILRALQWRRTSVMGLAWFSNQAFVSVDILMLGVLGTTQQVGLYGASYRVLNQVLVTYYLFVNALYPRFARQYGDKRRAMLRPRILFSLAAAGVLVASVAIAFRRPVLVFLFGAQFLAAAPLFAVLACAVPLDFLVSYLSSAYIAWSMEREVLGCALVAAGSNVLLNWWGIPRYGALAAAVNTVISYVIYLGTLALASRAVIQTAPAD
jgi:O-antigen/teichoic acid export membrane protein